MDPKVSFIQKKGRPLPKRGQIKAQIFGSLVRSLVPNSSKKWRKNKQEDGSSNFTSPALSGYTSEASSDS